MTQIEAFRRKLGWSQKRMGDALGVSQAAIHNMEKGQTMRRSVAKLFDLLVERLDVAPVADEPGEGIPIIAESEAGHG